MKTFDISDVPCVTCQNEYIMWHVCESLEYCPCDSLLHKENKVNYLTEKENRISTPTPSEILSKLLDVDETLTQSRNQLSDLHQHIEGLENSKRNLIQDLRCILNVLDEDNKPVDARSLSEMRP